MARPVHCAMQCRNMPIAMVYHWTHAAMVSILAKGEAVNESFRQHGASKDSPDLPTAHALGLLTPNNVSDVEKSPHAEISRHFIHQEFNGRLQAGTFAPAPA